jgi:GT2 family glycosyltransferase
MILPNMKTLVSVISPNFNRPDLISNLIADLEKQEQVEIEIIIVDDCSTDNSVEITKLRHPNAIVLRNNVNSGPAVSRNKGILYAKGDIIVGLDSDVTLPDSLTLKRTVDTLTALPAKHALAFRVFETDGKKDDHPRWYHPRPISLYADKEFETTYFSGTAFAFRRRELIDSGLFLESIFQYYEENALSYRFIDYGGTLIYKPDLFVLHHPGVRPPFSNHRLYHNPRSQIILAISLLPWHRAIFFLLTRLGAGFFRSLRYNSILLFAKGAIDGFKTACANSNKRNPLSSATFSRIKKITSQR